MPITWPIGLLARLASQHVAGLDVGEEVGRVRRDLAGHAAGMRLLAGLVRSIAPIENCVIFDSAPVGVHEVSAIELVQMTASTKISGSEMNAAATVRRRTRARPTRPAR